MFVCVKRKYVRVGELVLVIVNLYNFQKKALFFAWLLVVQLLRYILIFNLDVINMDLSLPILVKQ